MKGLALQFWEMLVNRHYRQCGDSLLLIVLFLLVPKKIPLQQNKNWTRGKRTVRIRGIGSQWERKGNLGSDHGEIVTAEN